MLKYSASPDDKQSELRVSEEKSWSYLNARSRLCIYRGASTSAALAMRRTEGLLEGHVTVLPLL